jgi:Synergist-CTERM protein sorting domain-containing protein
LTVDPEELQNADTVLTATIALTGISPGYEIGIFLNTIDTNSAPYGKLTAVSTSGTWTIFVPIPANNTFDPITYGVIAVVDNGSSYITVASTTVTKLGMSDTPDDEDNDEDEDVDQYVEPTGVDFNVEELNLKVGETGQLRWTFKPFATTVRGVTLTSSYPNIATVDDQGLVRAVAAGTTVVTIETRNGLTDTVRVVVEEWEPDPEPEPEPPTPTEPSDDPTLASFADPLPTSLAAGDPVEFTVTIDPKYNVSTLALVGVNWDVAIVDEETVAVTGVMPNSSVTFHFTATETESGAVYKSPDTSIALATEPEPEPTPAKKSSSGGCDAGFAGLALLLAAPLFIRKKD